MLNNNFNNILDFWFSDRVRPLHFQKSDEFDKEISDNYLETYKLAFDAKLDDWSSSGHGSLALIIILDQFPRNMFRNTPLSFQSDKKAINFSKKAIIQKFPANLTKEQCSFLYMPFMHSEDLSDQETSVKLYEELGIKNNLNFAIAHLDIIKRFGRFPHRNQILNRQSTQEEIEFLKQPNSRF